MLKAPPSIHDGSSEPFSSGSNSTLIIGLIVAIVAVVLFIIVLLLLRRGAARRASDREKEDEATAERERMEDEALEDEQAAAAEEPDEITVIQTKRAYVVGYGKEPRPRRHSNRTEVVYDKGTGVKSSGSGVPAGQLRHGGTTSRLPA